MSEPFLGEIEFFAFPFAPKGWMSCAGQMLPVQQNAALFALLGITFGGDGQTTFALPDLRGRVPVGQGQGTNLANYPTGQAGGSEGVALTPGQIPSHAHTVGVVAQPPGPSVGSPSGKLLSVVSTTVAVEIYGTGPATAAMSSNTVADNDGGQAHENRMPFQVLNPCIAVVGFYPSHP